MTMAGFTLESFDDDTSGPRQIQSAEYQKGLEDGVARAQLESTAQQAKALSDISASLADMAFGYAEARSELLNQIRPVIAQISEAVLPALAQETFSTHLIETLENAFARTTDQTAEISVAPDMVSVLSDADLGFEPVPDPTLTLGQARLQGGGTHIMIDLPSLVSDLQKALLGLDSTQRNQAHG